MSTPSSENSPLQAEAVFYSAVELPAEDREAFVGEQCRGDATLHARVLRLLTAHDSSANFMATVLSPRERADSAPTKTDAAGECIGPYRLISKIGEGGFGVVWLAEQDRPVKRHVALKIIRLGMDTAEVIARFGQERQALAVMDHPNIAKVFDAGATPTGRPFFAMELVRGVKITEFCDENALSTEQRLELFVQVCHAVQHAHQKGIIHRDLKPSNILVETRDGQPVPKVIDFGVAKATGAERLAEVTLRTRMEQMVGTPLYMSPEQAALGESDIDTRSDIYSLGVLLYEMLTGRPPFDAKTLMAAGFDEMRRIIREVEPPRPSTRLITLAEEELRSTARLHASEPRKLTSVLRGDLDWIVMKAIEKDRGRRYETADAFATDLRRHLAHEPVEAGPPSSLYRLRKLLRRRKGAIAATACVVLALIGGAVASLWQAMAATAARDEAMAARNQATAARDEAMAARNQATVARDEARKEAAISKAVNKFNKDLLGSASPRHEPDRDLKVRAVLDRAAASIGDRFHDQPLVEAEIRANLSGTYLSLGEIDKAREHGQRSVELRLRVLGPEHRLTLQCRNDLANVLKEQGKYAEAEAEHRAVLGLMERILGSDDPDTLRSHNNLATALSSQGKFAEAEVEHRTVFKIRERILGPEHPDTLSSRGNLATVLHHQGKNAEAEAEHRAVLKIREKILGFEHPDTLIGRQSLALILGSQGKSAEGEAELREVLLIRERVLGPEHPETLDSRNNLANVLHRQGKYAEAESEHRAVLIIQERVLGPEHPATLKTRMNAANSLNFLGNSIEAEAEHRAVLKIRERVLGPEDPDTLSSRDNLAVALRSQHKYADEEAEHRAIFRIRARVLGPEHSQTLVSSENLANALHGQAKYAEAEAERRAVLKIKERVLGPEHPDTLISLHNLALDLKAQGQLDEAREIARRAMESRRKVLGSTHPKTRKSEKLYEGLTSEK